MVARSLSRITLALGVVLTMVPGASNAKPSSRVFLLGADTGHLYYSVDASDPEASVSTIHRKCSVVAVPPPPQPCFTGLLLGEREYGHSLSWMPGTLFQTPATWSSAEPLRFHLELDVDTAADHTVHLGIQKGTLPLESAPATEISPGVWEGTLSGGSPLASGETVNLIYVRVRTPAPSIAMTMGTAGASYLEIPQPAQASGIPELLAEHNYHPAPASYSTEQRTFWFNDDAWEAASFQGDLTAARRFETQLSRRAEMVIAWVEAFEAPFVHDVLRGREPDPRKVTNSPVISLLRDDEELTHGGNNGATGRGEDALAVTDLGAGPLTLEVRPPELGDHSYAYTAHVLAIYGARTLERMRWSFQIDHEGTVLPAFRTPVGISCPGAYEVIPTTKATTTFSIDLDWDTQAPGLAAFTPHFSLPGVGSFGCGGAGAGDRMRLTVPGQRVWRVGAAPASGTTFASWRDTVFEMDVRYAYTRPPAS